MRDPIKEKGSNGPRRETKVGSSSIRCGAITRVLVDTFHACLSLASPATQVRAYSLPRWVRAAIGAAIIIAGGYLITSTT
jgi:hypothetical protein